MRLFYAAVLVGATVAIASGNASLNQDTKNTLTPIDTVPTRQQIDLAFNNDALQNLSSIATDENSSEIGVRLRAIHALAKYCSSTPCSASDAAHQSLATVITANEHEITGSKVLVLRAAIETMGAMRVGSDANLLLDASLLDHPSRDIRATTARALQDICNNQSRTINALRVRYSHELTEQVKLAISEALRILGQCSANQ